MAVTRKSDPIVYVVDDDPGMRTALCLRLTYSGFDARACHSAEAFLSQPDSCAASCVVLDLQLSGMSGLDLMERLGESRICPPVVFLTGHANIQIAVRAFKLGAFDFLEKPIDPEILVGRVRQAVASVIGGSARRAELQRIRVAARSLTDTEWQVLSLLKQGCTTAEIAGEVHCSPRTVDKHRMHILRKMGAKNIADLVRCACLLELSGVSPAAGLYSYHNE